jgi:hypothetical protein
MRRKYHSLFAAASLLACTMAAAQTNAGCLDGVCIGASVASLPPQIAWNALDPQLARSYVTPNTKDKGEQAAADQRLANAVLVAKKVYPAAAIDYAKIADVMALQSSQFDSKVLPSLSRLSLACKAHSWTGSFTNAQGLLTEVRLMLYPALDAAGNGNSMRVQRITRYFPEVALGAEMQTLRERLQKQISMPINDSNRSDKDLSPLAMLARSPAKGAAILEIMDMPLGRFDERKLAQQTACAN